MDRIGFCISMYNEYDTIRKSLLEIRKYYNDKAYIIIVRSDTGIPIPEIEKIVNKMIVYNNLASTIKKHKLPSHALSRNYGAAFTELYNTNINFKYIIALCGDTLVTDASNFDRRFDEMCKNTKLACVSQAIGQNFHASDSDPANGICGGRLQTENITDFMPQFFIIDGKFASTTKVFSKIKIVNEFTSEHCLGNELVRALNGNFKEKVIRLARRAYDYNDGIIFNRR